MFIFHINGGSYSSDHSRSFFIHKREPKAWGEKAEYIVVESWHTPNSQGDTKDFCFYHFVEFPDAMLFVVNLTLELNTPVQNALLKAADDFATDVIRQHREGVVCSVFGIDKPAPEPTPKPPPKPTSLIAPLGGKCVYVFDMGNGTVKIGVSQSVGSRKRTIENSSGQDIMQYYFTAPIQEQCAFQYEAECHAHFNSCRRKRGEFFNLDFKEAVSYLKSILPKNIVSKSTLNKE